MSFRARSVRGTDEEDDDDDGDEDEAEEDEVDEGGAVVDEGLVDDDEEEVDIGSDDCTPRGGEIGAVAGVSGGKGEE
jgi:hypothetical protein